jgi:hypothetical protein
MNFFPPSNRVRIKELHEKLALFGRRDYNAG